jgi:toxin ParE1/3/4
MAYRLSKRAAQDVIDIYAYGAREFGVMQAEKYHESLTRIFNFLSEHPLAARERTEFSPPVRIHAFGAHVVIYLSGEAGALIVRVLGGRQDLAEYF